ncbi:MAG: hypothetical protein EP330_16420 [Deltaproteobacteria bacterium]|nr:MAG: hypothetical protein EP330_16420 [Deltaproteobacteria bacterium]
MRTALVLTLMLAAQSAGAQSLALTDRAGGLPQCELELDDAYTAVEETIAERDAALKDAQVRDVADFIAAVTMARIRKKPDLLTAEWDELLDESITLIKENPLLAPAGFGENVGAASERLRKRPDLLMQEWDALIEENLEMIRENPLTQEASQTYEVALDEGLALDDLANDL